MKTLLLLLLPIAVSANPYKYKDAVDTVKVSAQEEYEQLKKFYNGKKIVQKLNKIIYIKMVKKEKTLDRRCIPLRSEHPMFVCRVGIGYSEACYLSGTDISFKVSCKAYDDQRKLNIRYGNPHVFSK